MGTTKTRKVIWISLIVAITHFCLSYYVIYQLGSAVGTRTANLLMSAMENPDRFEETYRLTRVEIQAETKYWRATAFVLSLPLGPITEPLWRQMHRNLVYEPVLAKEKTFAEVRTVTHLIGISHILLNSIAFSLCIVGMWFAYVRFSMCRPRSNDGFNKKKINRN